MKKQILLLLGVLIALPAGARQLSADEALLRLSGSSAAKGLKMRSLQSDAQPRLLKSISAQSAEEPALYLFAQSDRSVLVVSASTCAPALLGYFDNPDNMTSVDNLPANFEYWLSEYAAQIQYAEANPGKTELTAPTASKPAVEPLVKTKWNQDDPFNLQCPVFSGEHAVTGCVATAFAQVMNYHKWPARGTGSHTYQVNYSDAGLQQFSIDFSKIEFDWDAMLNEYDSNSSERSKNAVAALMKACGYSVDMQYGVNSSGAVTSNIINAAQTYFGYSDKVYFAERNNYTSPQWEALVYSQLEKGLPLIYSGRDGIWSDSSGHCFVCDGYDGNGYYHFNWGWGGTFDGYFLMSAITPEGAGIGGSVSGYNVRQACVVNLHPSNSNVEETTGYVGYYLTVESASRQIAIGVIPENASLAKPKLTFGLEFTSETSGKSAVLNLGEVALGSSGYYYVGTTLSAAALSAIGLTNGSYEARFVYNNNGNWTQLLYDLESDTSARVTINGSTLTLAAITRPCPLKISNVRFNDTNVICKGAYNRLIYTATNESDEPIYWAALHFLVPPGQSLPTSASASIYNNNIVLMPRETREITQLIPAGNIASLTGSQYYVAMAAGADSNVLKYIYQGSSAPFGTTAPISDGKLLYRSIGNGKVEVLGPVAAASELTGEVVIPDKITVQGTNYAVTEIGYRAFYDYEKITSVVIPKSITSIGYEAFVYCFGLTSVALPAAVTSIGYDAFFGCVNLRSIYSLNPEPPVITSDNTFYYVRYATLYVPKNSVSKYVAAPGWDYFGTGKTKAIDDLVKLTISKASVDAAIGETIALSVSVSGTSSFIVAATGKWTSDNEAVATVDGNGTVKAVGPGTAVITYSVESRVGSIHTASGQVKVHPWGDADGDMALTAADVELTARGVVKDIDSALLLKAVDRNGDSKLTVGELTQVVGAVVGRSSAAKAPEVAAAGFGTSDIPEYTPGSSANMPVKVELPQGASALQFTVTLPSAFELGSENLVGIGAGLQTKVRKESSNVYNYVIYTPDNSPINTSGNYLFALSLKAKATGAIGSYSLKFSNIIAAQPSGVETTMPAYNAPLKIVSATKPAESIVLNPTSASLKPGESLEITATVMPEDATDKTVKWSTTNKNVATVDADGKVTALACGMAVITAKCGNVSAKCVVNVVPIYVESITLTPEQWSAVEGETIQLVATVLPDDATDKSLIWTSSDETVASVDSNGLVSILKASNCVITATAADGSGITAQCIITGLTGIDEIFAAADATADVYTASGVLLIKGCTKARLQQLSPGIYILRQGNVITKLAIKRP